MTRNGIGYDVHRLVEGRKLVLGGVAVPFERGLAGHSDADVVCHALADALLGAMAAGDIGGYFPDTDEKWRDADSLVLLRLVRERVAALGATVANVDVTIVAERPELASHIEEMRSRLAGALAVDMSRVSVKATTTEGLGVTGRGEGIAAMAVASVATGGE